MDILSEAKLWHLFLFFVYIMWFNILMSSSYIIK